MGTLGRGASPAVGLGRGVSPGVGMSAIGSGMASAARVKVSCIENAWCSSSRQSQDGRIENMENKLGQLMDMLKQE